VALTRRSQPVTVRKRPVLSPVPQPGLPQSGPVDLSKPAITPTMQTPRSKLPAPPSFRSISPIPLRRTAPGQIDKEAGDQKVLTDLLEKYPEDRPRAYEEYRLYLGGKPRPPVVTGKPASPKVAPQLTPDLQKLLEQRIMEMSAQWKKQAEEERERGGGHPAARAGRQGRGWRGPRGMDAFGVGIGTSLDKNWQKNLEVQAKWKDFTAKLAKGDDGRPEWSLGTTLGGIPVEVLNEKGGVVGMLRKNPFKTMVGYLKRYGPKEGRKKIIAELREIARKHPEYRKYLGITIKLVDWGINKAKRALLNEETKRKRRTKKGS
jgi:hypothetical protein